MNKYTETIQEALESERATNGLFDILDRKFNLNIPWGIFTNKLSAILTDQNLKLSYLYLLSIVEQETADEMIELLKEPA